MNERRAGSQRRNSTNLKSLSPLRASISLSLQVRRTSVALRKESSSTRKSRTASEEVIPAEISAVIKKHLNQQKSPLQKGLNRVKRVVSDGTGSEETSFWQRLRVCLRCFPIERCCKWLTSILAVFISYGFLVVLTKEDAIPHSFCTTNTYDQIPLIAQHSPNLSSSSPSTFIADNFTGNESQYLIDLALAQQNVSAQTATPAPPCVGRVFALYIIFILALIVGHFMKVLHLPPLLGMLLVGLALRNVPYLQVAAYIPKPWSVILRHLALCIILTRAGLCLDPATLKRLSIAVFRLAFVPCLVESSVDALASYFLLGFPWEWGFMLGFVLGAVSPAVVVLSMLKLEAQGYGVAKGVPTLVIAAASMDDVLAITGFSFALGIAFQRQENVVFAFLRGPLEALAGILYGLIVGAILWYIPIAKHKNLVFLRSFFLIGSGIIILLGSIAIHIPGAGAIGVLTLSLAAGYGWRKRDGWDEENNPVIPIVDSLWWIAQPLLFGLIGAEVELGRLSGSSAIMGMLVVVIGLASRMIASFLVVFGIGLSWSEMFFIPLAWLPKATVQAAIGPVALDTAYQIGQDDPETIHRGNLILTIAALVILTTAPLGAALINFCGPRMMHKENMDIILDSNEAFSGRDHPYLLPSYNNSEISVDTSSIGKRMHVKSKKSHSITNDQEAFLTAVATSLSPSTAGKMTPSSGSHLRAGSASTTQSGTHDRSA